MPIQPKTTRSTRACVAAVAALGAVLVGASGASALNLLFAEDFDGIPLGTSPTYGLPGAYSADPPSGPLSAWDRQDNLPGFNDPTLGVLEFKGWNFWDRNLWEFVAGGARGRFERGRNVVAVADPDTWNDLNNPAQRGNYNTLIATPFIPLGGVGPRDRRLVLGFDTSWRGGCCTSGRPVPNNQTAIVRARVDGGEFQEVFRWESAPFYTNQGVPTDEPIDDAGNTNTPNEFFVAREFDTRFYIDFSQLLGGFAELGGEGLALATSNSSSSAGGIQLEFAMEDAGDDGWWAVDNVELASFGTLYGDMNLNDKLDLGDYDAFALAMLDTIAYQSAYSGAFPVEHGSLDSEFDFDDIPDFLSVMEGIGPPPVTSAFWSAYAVPEPTAGMLLLLGSLGFALSRPPRHS